ncbi:hypothetical protein CF326_g6718 [Tilletia indica]|nr:hypothetical protein CF326_g6718 [Tilletia indica]
MGSVGDYYHPAGAMRFDQQFRQEYAANIANIIASSFGLALSTVPSGLLQPLFSALAVVMPSTLIAPDNMAKMSRIAWDRRMSQEPSVKKAKLRLDQATARKEDVQRGEELLRKKIADDSIQRSERDTAILKARKDCEEARRALLQAKAVLLRSQDEIGQLSDTELEDTSEQSIKDFMASLGDDQPQKVRILSTLEIGLAACKLGTSARDAIEAALMWQDHGLTALQYWNAFIAYLDGRRGRGLLLMEGLGRALLAGVRIPIAIQTDKYPGININGAQFMLPLSWSNKAQVVQVYARFDGKDDLLCLAAPRPDAERYAGLQLFAVRDNEVFKLTKISIDAFAETDRSEVGRQLQSSTRRLMECLLLARHTIQNGAASEWTLWRWATTEPSQSLGHFGSLENEVQAIDPPKLTLHEGTASGNRVRDLTLQAALEGHLRVRVIRSKLAKSGDSFRIQAFGEQSFVQNISATTAAKLQVMDASREESTSSQAYLRIQTSDGRWNIQLQHRSGTGPWLPAIDPLASKAKRKQGDAPVSKWSCFLLRMLQLIQERKAPWDVGMSLTELVNRGVIEGDDRYALLNWSSFVLPGAANNVLGTTDPKNARKSSAIAQLLSEEGLKGMFDFYVRLGSSRKAIIRMEKNELLPMSISAEVARKLGPPDSQSQKDDYRAVETAVGTEIVAKYSSPFSLILASSHGSYEVVSLRSLDVDKVSPALGRVLLAIESMARPNINPLPFCGWPLGKIVKTNDKDFDWKVQLNNLLKTCRREEKGKGKQSQDVTSAGTTPSASPTAGPSKRRWDQVEH